MTTALLTPELDDAPRLPPQRVLDAPPNPSLPSLTLRPARIAAAMLLVIGVLAALSCVARYLLVTIPPDSYRGVREICLRFDLDRENTLPAWYASMTLLACGGLFGLTAALQPKRKAFRLHWFILAATFVYLAIDESASLHEILIVPLRRRLDAGGLLYFAWVIPGAVAVALFGLSYLRFLFHLPRRTAKLLIAAGATFVGGALGLELFGGALAEAEGLMSFRYTLMMTAEEMLEMGGVVVLVYALLDHLGSQVGVWSTRIATD